MGRDKIQYIDINYTSNGHIEIDDMMRPMHDNLRSAGERVVPMLKSVTITTHKSTTLEGYPKNYLCIFLAIEIVETNKKFLS